MMIEKFKIQNNDTADDDDDHESTLSAQALPNTTDSLTSTSSRSNTNKNLRGKRSFSTHRHFSERRNKRR